MRRIRLRRIGLLVVLAVFGIAGVAYAAVTNVYVIGASFKPHKSGTSKHPTPVSIGLGWLVGTEFAGLRPNVVRGYHVFLEGLLENTNFFPGCDTSKLSGRKGNPGKCPRGSEIGRGDLILEIGPTGEREDQYNAECRADVLIFNGGDHNLTLYVYRGRQLAHQPAPCTIPGDHVVINVRLAHSKHGLNWNWSVPLDLLHPAPGIDAAVIYATLSVPSKEKALTRRVKGKSHHTKIGLFETYLCPHNHQRQVAITFTEEDGVGRTGTTLVACK
jgi:hypothetical protein